MKHFFLEHPIIKSQKLFIALLLTFVTLALFSCGSEDNDSRKALLDADIEAVQKNSLAADSIVATIKEVFKSFANEDTKPENFNFLIKENPTKDKLLVLIRIPKLHKIVKEDWGTIIGITDTIIMAYPYFKAHKKYYGLVGDNFINGVKTPTFYEVKKFAKKEELYPFYGEADIVEKKE